MEISGKRFLVLAVFAAAISIEIVSAGPKDMKCKGMDITMTEQQMKNVKDCATKMGVTAPEQLTKEKIGCFSKCIMEKKMLVDDKGMPHKENINKLIDSTMPEPVRADLKAKFAACMEKNGGKLDATDASCMSYVPLAMCTHSAMTEVCK